jgi:hypothetical protein
MQDRLPKYFARLRKPTVIMNNAQTFSQNADQYAKSRPQYPDELFASLNALKDIRILC